MNAVLSVVLDSLPVENFLPDTGQVEIHQKEDVLPCKKFSITLCNYFWKTFYKKELIRKSEEFVTEAGIFLPKGVSYTGSNIKFQRNNNELLITAKCSVDNSPSQFYLKECNAMTSFTDTSVWIGFDGGHIAIGFLKR